MPLSIRDVYEAEDRNLFLVSAAVIEEVIHLKTEAMRKAQKNG